MKKRVKTHLKRACYSALAIVMCLSLSAVAHANFCGLTEDIKTEYYAEYLKIAAEVSKEMEQYISVIPKEEIEDEDWLTPKEFRSVLEAVSSWRIVCNETEPQLHGANGKTKTASILIDNRTYKVSVTGSFITQYKEQYHAQRFCGIECITSKAASNGTWTQTGYDYNLVELGRTYQITVSGTFEIAAARFENKLAYVEFYCDAKGRVS